MKRVRQHVNPLKSDLLEIPVSAIEAPAGRALEVELGSAEAHFLMDRARVDQQTLFVGIEIRREMVTRTNVACERLGLSNVRSVFANMSVDLPRLFAGRSVRRFHINFPDPWFKSRQHKRRVVGPALVHELEAALTGDGEIFVQTDIFDIALDAMAALESDGRFVNVREPWRFFPHNPFEAKSRRERQCEGEGTPIWRLLYRNGAGASRRLPAGSPPAP